jgi:hypothetical protein
LAVLSIPRLFLVENLYSGRGSRDGKAVGANVGISDARQIGMDSTMNKASVPFFALALLVIAAVAAKIRAAIDAQVPEGYEDETGFHFGSPNLKG